MIHHIQCHSPDDLYTVFSIMEHSDPIRDITYMAHYEVAGLPAQDIYIALPWIEVKSKIILALGVADGALDLVIISATILDFDIGELT